MAEAVAALGVVSSIIAIVELSAAVGKQVYRYAECIRSAKEDVERIGRQLKDVRDILVKLQKLADGAVKSGGSLDNWPTLGKFRCTGLHTSNHLIFEAI